MVNEMLLEHIESFLEKRSYLYAQSTLIRNRYFLTKMLTDRKQLADELIHALKEQRIPDTTIVVNNLVDWIYKAHKTFIPCFYVFMTFYEKLFGKVASIEIRDNIKLKYPTKKSERVLTDYDKLNTIMASLPEPMDIMAKIQWETACRSGAVLKMQFHVPEHTQEWLEVIKIINDYKIDRGENADSVYEEGGHYYVKLHEKRGKIIDRPVTKETYAWIMDYMEYRKHQMLTYLGKVRHGKLKPLWVNKIFGNRIFNIRIRWYNTLLTEKGREVGLEKFSSHWFRGSRARHLLNNHINIIDIKNIMGHSHLDTTTRYIDLPITGKEDMILDTLKKKVIQEV